MAGLTNMFADIPADLPEELVQTLLSTLALRIERIVSLGHASPEGFWYDQDTHEWVPAADRSGPAQVRGGGAARPAARFLRQHPRPQATSGRMDRSRASRPSGWRCITECGYMAPDGATTVAEEEKLKLGKGAAFVKSRLKRLPQDDETWEADFRALPKPISRPRRTTWGWSSPGGRLAPGRSAGPRQALGQRPRHAPGPRHAAPAGRERPPAQAHPPAGAPPVAGTIPHLAELGVEVSVEQELPGDRGSLRGPPAAVAGGPPGRHGQADRRAGEGRDDVPGHRPVGPGYGYDRDRRPGEVRLRRPGDRLRRTRLRGRHGPTRWPRRWPSWRRDWPGGSRNRESNSNSHRCETNHPGKRARG